MKGPLRRGHPERAIPKRHVPSGFLVLYINCNPSSIKSIDHPFPQSFLSFTFTLNNFEVVIPFVFLDMDFERSKFLKHWAPHQIIISYWFAHFFARLEHCNFLSSIYVFYFHASLLLGVLNVSLEKNYLLPLLDVYCAIYYIYSSHDV